MIATAVSSLVTDGRAAGSRAIDLRVEGGIELRLLPDRGLDAGDAWFAGVPLDWRRAALWVAPILRDLLAQPWQPGTLWNINLPHLDPGAPPPEAVVCRVDPGPLPISYREDGDGSVLVYDGNYHERRREPGADVDVCFGGRIAVSRISLL